MSSGTAILAVNHGLEAHVTTAARKNRRNLRKMCRSTSPRKIYARAYIVYMNRSILYGL
jgi:hypothetical protein